MDEEEFRFLARTWLAAHAGPYRTNAPALPFTPAGDDAGLERGRAWQRELAAGSWAGLGWPAEYGGRGLPLPFQAVWAEELASVGAPAPVNLVGEAVVGPAIMAHGSDHQRRRYLPPILDAGEIWCQLFSEPGAGSDLAAVAATASVNDGRWTVSGHKTWSSGAHHADCGLLLARTDPQAPKHRGLTCFLLDMGQRGVTVHPVRQMTGMSAFDDVLLDGAQVDDTDRLGPAGAGWAVALTALAAERSQIGVGLARTGAGVDRLLAELRSRQEAADPVVRQLAAQLVIDAKVARLLAGSHAELAKLASGRVARRYDALVDAMRGAGAMLTDAHTLRQLWLPATRIAGGTDEVLKNVLAERVLGLPRGA